MGLMMDPGLTEGLISEIEPRIKEMTDQGHTPLIVTTSELRLAFRRFMEPSFPQLVILSYQELPSETRIEPFAAIAIADQVSRGGSPSYGKLGGKPKEISRKE